MGAEPVAVINARISVLNLMRAAILSVCCLKARFFVSSDHRSQSNLKFQSCLTT